MNRELIYLFQIPLYQTQNVLSHSENDDIKNKVLDIAPSIDTGGDWNCNTFNSMGKFDLRQDQMFSKINETIIENVNYFSRDSYNSFVDYKILDSWFNISSENCYQEYHMHADSVFSAVYYVRCPSGSGDIVFDNPQDQMISLKNVDEMHSVNSNFFAYTPSEGDLLIFRSSLRHMVKMGYNKEPRVSLAYNFIAC
tara:strand:- start:64 stop:651 length:588 start_codon:yes stop_codon:yes gene_type:complete